MTSTTDHRRLSLLTPTGHLTLGNLLGALRPMAAEQHRRRLLLRHLRPARADHAARPGGAARADPREGDAAARRRPRREHAVRAEPGAGAQPAGLPARVRGAHRRAEPDDPVQGEGAGRRVDPGLAAHLPGADGRRHPALPAGAGAGRRRPAPARRAHPRPRDPVQPHLRAGVHGPGDHHAAGGRPGQRPGRPDPQDGQVRRRRRARSGCSTRPTSYAARSRARSPTPTPDRTRCGPPTTSRASPTCSTSWPPAAGRPTGSRRTARSSGRSTDAVVAELEPLQKRYAELAADPAYVSEVYEAGAARCREVTAPVLAAAQAAMGL